jgi:putative oxidoreductase
VLTRLLTPFTETAYALLRCLSGFMFSLHGMQKLLGVLGGEQQPVGSQLWFGGLIELVCGLAIAVGLQTRWAAFLASGTMAVAYVQFHWNLRLDANFFPVVNKGELALLYSLVFLFLACRGGGLLSFDRRAASKAA